MEVYTCKSCQGKTFTTKMIIISIKENNTFNVDDAFPASFQNIFINYPLGEMETTDTKWKHWNTAPLRLWQTQFNFTGFAHQALAG